MTTKPSAQRTISDLQIYMSNHMKDPSSGWFRIVELRLAGMPIDALKPLAQTDEERDLLCHLAQAESRLREKYLTTAQIRSLYALSMDQVNVDVSRGRFTGDEYFRKGRMLMVLAEAAQRLYGRRDLHTKDRRFKKNTV